MPQPSRHVTARITFRKGTTAEWAAADPILMDAEPSVDTTVNKFKIGDGESRWSQLSYVQNMASTNQEWTNNGSGSFPNEIQSPEEAINYLGDTLTTTSDRVTALETEIDGGTYS
jgi:hypothetical protein